MLSQMKQHDVKKITLLVKILITLSRCYFIDQKLKIESLMEFATKARHLKRDMTIRHKYFAIEKQWHE